MDESGKAEATGVDIFPIGRRPMPDEDGWINLIRDDHTRDFYSNRKKN